MSTKSYWRRTERNKEAHLYWSNSWIRLVSFCTNVLRSFKNIKMLKLKISHFWCFLALQVASCCDFFQHYSSICQVSNENDHFKKSTKNFKCQNVSFMSAEFYRKIFTDWVTWLLFLKHKDANMISPNTNSVIKQPNCHSSLVWFSLSKN